MKSVRMISFFVLIKFVSSCSSNQSSSTKEASIKDIRGNGNGGAIKNGLIISGENLSSDSVIELLSRSGDFVASLAIEKANANEIHVNLPRSLEEGQYKIKMQTNDRALENDIYILRGEKGEQGEQGVKGEKGDTGPQGPTGPQGEKGDQGENALGSLWLVDSEGNAIGPILGAPGSAPLVWFDSQKAYRGVDMENGTIAGNSTIYFLNDECTEPAYFYGSSHSSDQIYRSGAKIYSIAENSVSVTAEAESNDGGITCNSEVSQTDGFKEATEITLPNYPFSTPLSYELR